MSKWVVGCLIAVLLCVGAVGAVLYFFISQSRQVAEEMERVGAEYAELNAKHPFQPPADGLLDAERYRRFLEVRGLAARVVREVLGTFKEKGVMDKMRAAFSVGPEVGKAHVDALTSATMSLNEYRFYADEFYLVLRENASREPARQDPALSELYDAMKKYRENMTRMQDQKGGEGFVDLLEEVAPGRLNVPEPNRELVARHKQPAVEAVDAYFLDFGLRRFRKELHDLETKRQAPATPAPADVEKK